MLLTIPTSAATLRSLLSAGQQAIVDGRRQTRGTFGGNYSVEIYHESGNTVTIDMVDTATLLAGRPIKASSGFSFVVADLEAVSLIASASTNVRVTIV